MNDDLGRLFDRLASRAQAAVGSDEAFTLGLSAETSDFVRFNHGQVRQAGTVAQATLDLRWVGAGRAATQSWTLSLDGDRDEAALDAAIEGLRALLPALPEDPHLLLDTVPRTEASGSGDAQPTPDEVIDAVVSAAHGEDLVGFYQAGPVHRALASSHGHRLWRSSRSYALDYSLFAGGDRAVKRLVAGTAWDPSAVEADVATARAMLPALRRPPRVVPPGAYRAWLSPAAVAEIVELLSWSGDFGARAQQLGTSSFSRHARGEAALHPRLAIAEHVSAGLATPWNADGFARPDRTALFEGGRHVGALVAPRTAVELGLKTNGADAAEAPVALSIHPGDLPDADVLAALGTGVWVGNLWYLNHTDRAAARLTGMTRFATFWVEDGEIVAPLAVMRFDDSLDRLWGSELEAIGATAAFLPATSTYGGRSLGSMSVPGMLVRELRFAL